MNQYRVVKPCYLPLRGTLRHVRAGALVKLSSEDAAAAEGHLELVRPRRHRAIPPTPKESGDVDTG